MGGCSSKEEPKTHGETYIEMLVRRLKQNKKSLKNMRPEQMDYTFKFTERQQIIQAIEKHKQVEFEQHQQHQQYLQQREQTKEQISHAINRELDHKLLEETKQWEIVNNMLSPTK